MRDIYLFRECPDIDFTSDKDHENLKTDLVLHDAKKTVRSVNVDIKLGIHGKCSLLQGCRQEHDNPLVVSAYSSISDNGTFILELDGLSIRRSEIRKKYYLCEKGQPEEA